MANEFNILDKTDGGWGYTFGKFDSPPVGMVFHHTAGTGRATADQVIKYFRQSRYPTQFVIDRDGVVHRALPEGARGQHMIQGSGRFGEGKSNANMEGVEIIAKDDRDVTPAQVEAARQLHAQRANRWGWDPATSAYGHGEVNPGHRQDTEGMTAVNAIRGTPTPVAAQAPTPIDPATARVTPLAGTAAQPRTSLTADPARVIGQPIPLDGPAPAPGLAPRSQLHGAPIPNPFADKTAAAAQKYGIPHSVFENLIRAESGFNPRITGGSGEMGLGQIAPGTAKDLGLDATSGYDIDQNLDASARYLSDQYKRTGSWEKALSAYNRGPKGAADTNYNLDRYARSPAGQLLIDSARSTDAAATGGPSGLEIKPPGQTALPAPPVDPFDPEPQFRAPRAYTRPSAISPDPIDPEPQPRPSFMPGGDRTPQDQKPAGFRPSAPGQGTPLEQGMRNWNSAQMLMALLNKGAATAQSVGPHYDPQAIANASTGAPAKVSDPWITGAPSMRVRVGKQSNLAMQQVQ